MYYHSNSSKLRQDGLGGKMKTCLVEVVERRYKGFYGFDVEIIEDLLLQYDEIVSIIKSESTPANFVIQISHVVNDDCFNPNGCYTKLFLKARPSAIDTFFTGYNFTKTCKVCSKIILVSTDDIFLAREDVANELYFMIDKL